MNKDEFIKSASKLGYANKKQTEKWCKKNAKDAYSESDYEDLFRFAQQPPIGSDYAANKYRYGFGCKTTKRLKVDGYK